MAMGRIPKRANHPAMGRLYLHLNIQMGQSPVPKNPYVIYVIWWYGNWLVVSNMAFMTFHIWDNPPHWRIFFRGVGQPPTSKRRIFPCHVWWLEGKWMLPKVSVTWMAYTGPATQILSLPTAEELPSRITRRSWSLGRLYGPLATFKQRVHTQGGDLKHLETYHPPKIDEHWWIPGMVWVIIPNRVEVSSNAQPWKLMGVCPEIYFLFRLGTSGYGSRFVSSTPIVGWFLSKNSWSGQCDVAKNTSFRQFESILSTPTLAFPRFFSDVG